MANPSAMTDDAFPILFRKNRKLMITFHNSPHNNRRDAITDQMSGFPNNHTIDKVLILLA